MTSKRLVAYFSMEIAYATHLHNYAGGLGVLAGDTLMTAADQGHNLVGVSLFYHQHDNPESAFRAERYLARRPETITVKIENREVKVAIWEKILLGRNNDYEIPIIFLSSYLPENAKWDRDLTKHLYAPDRYTRLGQEAILGVGGIRALETLGYKVDHYHLNEGHAALATLELLRRYDYDEARVRSLVSFTTHTPIAAGHDYFDYSLANKVLGDLLPWDIHNLAGQNSLGLTQLAMSLAQTTNSVSLRHREVCEKMFPQTPIKNVTNGIYASRWTGQALAQLFNQYLPNWEDDPKLLAETPARLPSNDLRQAKKLQKRDLINWVNFHKNFFAVNNASGDDLLETEVLTLGFARRFVPYKRPLLIFQDLERLAKLGGQRQLQLIFANRCHPDDRYCNDLHSQLNDYAEQLRGQVRIVLIPDYDLMIAKRLVTGTDVWLNTPTAPLEASGTSGMKAALNGALNLSTLDGWWLEGIAREPKSGWGFGGNGKFSDDNERDKIEAGELLDRLENIVALYYKQPDEWLERMKHSIALIGFFNTQRVLTEYFNQIWN